jgi:hypothetical protein
MGNRGIMMEWESSMKEEQRKVGGGGMPVSVILCRLRKVIIYRLYYNYICINNQKKNPFIQKSDNSVGKF